MGEMSFDSSGEDGKDIAALRHTHRQIRTLRFAAARTAQPPLPAM
jgi:hypothetical protein